jgi:hypothetical protein
MCILQKRNTEINTTGMLKCIPTFTALIAPPQTYTMDLNDPGGPGDHGETLRAKNDVCI